MQIKDIIKKWLNDLQIVLPDERVEMLETMIKTYLQENPLTKETKEDSIVDKDGENDT